MAAGGGGKSKGSGGSGTDKSKDKSGGGNADNGSGTQARDPAGPNGGISGGSESGPGAKSSGEKKGGGGQTGPKKPGTSYVDAIDDPVAKKNKEVNEDAQDLDEGGWFDSWHSFWDHVGKTLGAGFGIGEREQSFSETANDMAYGGATPANGDSTDDAHWGFDPAVAAANVAGSVLGGLGGGTVVGTAADALSEAAGRPFDIDLGTDVFGGDESSDTTDTPDTEGGGGNPGDTSTDGDPGGGGQDNEKDPVVSVPKPTKNEKPDTGNQTAQDTTQPTAGVGIDLLTQTNNVPNGGGVSVPDASKRRRRGTLGGLGLGGLAI